MSFKKVQLGKKNNGIKRVIPFALSIISVFLVFSLGIIFIDSTKGLKFEFFDFLNLKLTDISPLGFSNGWDTKTNILLIWRGGWKHDAPNLTDSIILASVDSSKNLTTMLSIPRDMLVKVDERGTWAKINEIYTRNLDLNKRTEEESILALKNKVSQITWEKIDYYVNIDFEGFKKFIDFIGWVEVTLEENLVDNEYPDGNLGYTTFVLRKGTWILDGETALKYARSRHSTSDFDRSLRQQEILSAIKNKVLNEGYISSPSKITQIFSIVSSYIKTDLDIRTILSLVRSSRNESKIVSFNLNDSCSYGGICFKWGFLYVPSREYFHGMSVLIPQKSDYTNIENYEDIQRYANFIFNNREIYEENLEINIYNSTKVWSLARYFANGLFKYGFNIPDKSIGNTKTDIYPATTIFYNWIPDDSVTLKAVQELLKAPVKKVEKALYSDSIDTKIEIVIGDDYATYENNF